MNPTVDVPTWLFAKPVNTLDGARAPLRPTVSYRQRETENHRLDVTVSLAPAGTRGDRALVERLIANLLDNAVRHNREGGWIALETTTKAGQAVLQVANSGEAIGREEIARLFEPFQRGGSERLAGNGHYGLGLSIARAIVLAHDGEITAEPEPAGGLAVTVGLPADPVGTQPT